MFESKKEIKKERDNAEMRALKYYSKIIKITDLIAEYNHSNMDKPMSANPYTVLNEISKIVKEEYK